MQANLFDIDTVFLTTKILIRRLREGEGAAVYNLVNNNRAFLEDHFPAFVRKIRSAEEGEAFARRKLSAWLLQEEYCFGIWHPEEANLIGYIQLSDIDWDIPLAEVSYFLDQNFTSQGLMTESLARIVQFGFKQLNLEKLRLRTLIDNYPSHRLARKIGFVREGDLRNEFRKPSGIISDLIQFGLTKEMYGL